jgi:hypothetical protein
MLLLLRSFAFGALIGTPALRSSPGPLHETPHNSRLTRELYSIVTNSCFFVVCNSAMGFESAILPPWLCRKATSESRSHPAVSSQRSPKKDGARTAICELVGIYAKAPLSGKGRDVWAIKSRSVAKTLGRLGALTEGSRGIPGSRSAEIFLLF